MIRRHHRAVESDLRREYGVRLRDLFTGDLSWRELSSYIWGLSPRSATRTAISGFVEPSNETVLMADVFDAISVLDYHLVVANTDENKAKAVKLPKPYPRWWLKQAKQDSGEARVAKLEDARRRRRERQQAIDHGLIV